MQSEVHGYPRLLQLVASNQQLAVVSLVTEFVVMLLLMAMLPVALMTVVGQILVMQAWPVMASCEMRKIH